MASRPAQTAGNVRRMNSYGTACLCCLLALLRPRSAAFAQYHIDSWTTDNGLPQNIIRDVCQAPDGYLWLATLDGLVRFDGVRFTVFNRSNTPGILGNRYDSLYCTRGGEFWAGTETSGSHDTAKVDSRRTRSSRGYYPMRFPE